VVKKNFVLVGICFFMMCNFRNFFQFVERQNENEGSINQLQELKAKLGEGGAEKLNGRTRKEENLHSRVFDAKEALYKEDAENRYSNNNNNNKEDEKEDSSYDKTNATMKGENLPSRKINIEAEDFPMQLEKPQVIVATETVPSSLESTIRVSKILTNKTFPDTKFTPHVKEIIAHAEMKMDEGLQGVGMGYWPEKKCEESYRIIVDAPYTAPSKIECGLRNPFRKFNTFCKFLRTILFANKTRILPSNVTIGVSIRDMEIRDKYNCLGSSARNGAFTMTNFQDIEIQVMNSEKTSFVHAHVSWEDRRTIPVFRGRLYYNKSQKNIKNLEKCPHVKELGPRAKAAYFSSDHPELLDATVSTKKHPCFFKNATNGMDRIFRWGAYKNDKSLSPSYIEPEDYYSKYQTSVVLGGIGAAFRTARHLSAGQAVVLQDFQYEEWYFSLMTPYEHYIPLKRDLSDLKEVMEWVREHPSEVKKIAEKGKQFYWDYLSFEQTENHWFELLWKLSLSIRDKGVLLTWPNGKIPMTYQRSATGDWKVFDAKEAL